MKKADVKAIIKKLEADMESVAENARNARQDNDINYFNGVYSGLNSAIRDLKKLIV